MYKKIKNCKKTITIKVTCQARLLSDYYDNSSKQERLVRDLGITFLIGLK
jgi:hypothetical protein